MSVARDSLGGRACSQSASPLDGRALGVPALCRLVRRVAAGGALVPRPAQLAYYSSSSGGLSSCTANVCTEPVVGLAADPHLALAGGGNADFKGKDGVAFVMVSARNFSFAATTTESHFMQNFGKQTVHGSHITTAHFTLRTNTTGALVHVTVTAAMTSWFKPYATAAIVGENAKPRKIGMDTKKQTPTFALEDVTVVAESNSKVVVRAARWIVELVRRTLYKPLPGSKVRNYLNVNIRMAGADPRGAHGIIGQSFAAAARGIKLEGTLDDYNGTEVTTSAQGEGAIEGVYTDYQIDSPFDTKFKYSRFDAAALPPVTSGASVLPLSAAVDDSEKA